MDSSSRRESIMKILRRSKTPVTGSYLASCLGVTRQVIVQDIALLKASGEPVIATPRGYILNQPGTRQDLNVIVAVKHSRDDTRDELYTMVDSGAEVVDVIVEHPIYGQLVGQLYLSSRYDVDEFMSKVEKTGAGLLSSLTDGVHLHTLRVKNPESAEHVRNELAKKGYLLE